MVSSASGIASIIAGIVAPSGPLLGTLPSAADSGGVAAFGAGPWPLMTMISRVFASKQNPDAGLDRIMPAGGDDPVRAENLRAHRGFAARVDDPGGSCADGVTTARASEAEARADAFMRAHCIEC